MLQLVVLPDVRVRVVRGSAGCVRVRSPRHTECDDRCRLFLVACIRCIGQSSWGEAGGAGLGAAYPEDQLLILGCAVPEELLALGEFVVAKGFIRRGQDGGDFEATLPSAWLKMRSKPAGWPSKGPRAPCATAPCLFGIQDPRGPRWPGERRTGLPGTACG